LEIFIRELSFYAKIDIIQIQVKNLAIRVQTINIASYNRNATKTAALSSPNQKKIYMNICKKIKMAVILIRSY
jgi:hypothetical protein